ncbi:MAG TPA: glycosyltransferase, partial [Patescibacteria group bacterium]|nr:glycosyltransferase [Patescibacteria group bacterium]
QDVITGLANKLMANFATKISISYEISAKDFFPGKTVLTGNPVRDEYYSCSQERGRQIFKLKSDRPVLLVLGGGTGSQKINEVLSQSLADILQFTQVIHLTGHGKQLDIQADGYQQFEFLTNDMTEALCAADMVVSRAGMSTLSELVILHKPTILIPLPGHQEYNAAYFQKNNAAFVMRQESLNKEIFVSSIKEFMFNQSNRENLSRNIAKMMDLNGAANVAKLLLDIAK